MDDIVTFKLPLPPTVNRMYIRVKRRVMLTREAREYKWTVERAMNEFKPPKFAPDSMIGFGMCVYPSNGREALRDVDNGVKIVLDGFQQAGLYANDRQVKEMHVKMMPIQRMNEGYIVVTFYSLDVEV
jgi:Holliday junction resolvase RusA-like endonuclease